MIGTKDPQQEHFMKISSFGAFHIEVIPNAGNPELMHVDIGAANRKETISMQTNKDETIDQFCTRIRSMLRGLSNGEPRILKEEEVPAAKKKDKTWEEQKEEMRGRA